MTLLQKAKAIRLAIFDVDGVLTNGQLLYAPDGTEMKIFHVHDGLGIKLLQQTGVEVAIITARESDVVLKRMQELNITHIYQGQSHKLSAYEDIQKKLNLSDQQIAYIGDDLPDLALIQRAGLGITVANAPSLLQEYAAWTTQKKGGEGAIREVCEFIMQAQGTYQGIIESFMMATTDL